MAREKGWERAAVIQVLEVMRSWPRAMVVEGARSDHDGILGMSGKCSEVVNTAPCDRVPCLHARLCASVNFPTFPSSLYCSFTKDASITSISQMRKLKLREIR